MAGGKESPRQRMIGMMYLVLTALLALQVSNQILQKFVLINDGLERTSKNYILKNEFAVQSIAGTVEQQGNNEKDAPKVEVAKELRKKTAEVFNYLESMKQELITVSNAKDDQGMYKTSALKNVDVSGNIFNNNKKGYEMQEILNTYPQEVSAMLKEIGIDMTFQPIAKDADQIDLFKNDPDVRTKDFVNLTFVKSPIGAVLTLISQFQNEVLNVESESLVAITNTIGSFYYKADIVQARIAALSNVVAAGTKFEADMFIASSSSSDVPRMTIDGREVPVEEGFGKIEFTATPGQYDDRGLSRRVIQGEIITNVGGEDQVLPIEYEYFVAQPVIRVTSEVVNQLYADCANDLMIDVPALGNSYSPSFAVSNGQAIAGTRPGQVTIIPGPSGKTVIGVSSGGNRIGDVSYDIKPVPMPTIVPSTNQGPIDLSQGIAPIQSILVKAEAEPTFARTMARDAKFEVTGGEITLVRSEVPRGSVNITGEAVGIRNLAEQAKAGDQFIIRVTEITRTNFQNRKIKMPLSRPQIIRIAIR
ncbi:gliding motility-associated protein GldM [Belliella baltica DSM 15883]|uniref:Gliding motility-associated protein GldM n=1 Tax=Belliella baltica (strain DSM 15883 / CIP 108006 / LMG 21964 / BA134) TaxID=866536 RepID=I3Z253_BELBD|nr:gliding motility protein GldM [Belliella baltica]AFL83321.1 gliding motility-associated protein GldM [Belliella baltica DSM 15883]